MSMTSCPHSTAIDLDMAANRDGLSLPAAGRLFTEIRAILYSYQNTQEISNNVFGLVKKYEPGGGFASIDLGPTMDRGVAGPEYFNFDNGARLSFGFTLKDSAGSSTLLGYRIHYQAPEGATPEFLRYDLNFSVHGSPLQEPLCHLHPGSDDIRVASPVQHPIHALEVILYVVNVQF